MANQDGGHDERGDGREHMAGPDKVNKRKTEEVQRDGDPKRVRRRSPRLTGAESGTKAQATAPARAGASLPGIVVAKIEKGVRAHGSVAAAAGSLPGSSR